MSVTLSGGARLALASYGNFGPGMAGMSFQVTEANHTLTNRFPGTLSNLSVSLSSLGTGRVMQARKNAANANMVSSFTDDTSQIITTSASNTDHVNSGDTYDFTMQGSSGLPQIYFSMFKLLADTGTRQIWCAATVAGPTSTTAVTYVPNGNGSVAASSTVITPMRTSGSMSFLSASVQTALSVPVTLTSNVNAAAGTQSVAISSNVTGTFADVTNSDTFSSATKIGFTAVSTGSGGGTFFGYAYFSYNAGSATEIFQEPLGFNASSLNTQFLSLFGGNGSPASLTEAPTKITLNEEGLLSNMRYNISTNTTTAATVVSLRKNGVNGNETISIGAATTGLFEDTTHTDTFIKTDTVNYALTGTSSTGASFATTGAVITAAFDDYIKGYPVCANPVVTREVESY